MLGGYYLGQLYLGISGLPAAGILSVVPSSHQLTSDNITLTQKHTLVVADALHGHTVGSVTLTQKHLLSVENAIHSLQTDNVAITSEQVLGIDSAFHGVTSPEVAITQKHTIVVDSTSHTVNSPEVDLTEHYTLVVQNTTHGHTAESPAIVVHFYLVVQNNLHGHTVQSPTLTQKQLLSVANNLHALTSTNLGGLINIQPDGFGGGFGANDGFGIMGYGEINIELPLNYIIFAQNSNHSLSNTAPTMTQRHTLTLDDDYMTQTSTGIDLSQIYWYDGGVYIQDEQDSGAMGSEYSPSGGTTTVEHGYFGQIAPDAESDNGFLIVKMGSSGSYTQNDLIGGILNRPNSGQGNLSTEVEDTGNYIKSNNTNGEYEEI